MTEPTPSGSRPSAGERLDAYAAGVEEVARERGLPTPQARDVSRYLSLTREDYVRLPRAELALAAVELEAYAYFLQDEVDRARVVADKCTHQINKTVVPRLANYDAFRFDDKVLQATLDSDFCRELHDRRALAQSYLTRYEWLPRKLGDLARSIQTYLRVRDGQE